MLKQAITNFKKNLKIKNTFSSLFNYYSNPSVKTSSTYDDLADISKELKDNELNEKNNISDKTQKELLNGFIKNIIIIIFDSRKEKNNNDFKLTNIKISDDSIDDFVTIDNSFNPKIEDLFLYNDFYSEQNDFQKLVIEFYLIKNKGNKKIKELVEKWKLTYKLNNVKEEANMQYIKNKMKLYIKSIISFSRLLPLYQCTLKNKNNSTCSIDFKFYQNNSNKKGKFSKKPNGNVLLKNQDIFSIKTNIKYYTNKELKNIFEKKENENCIDFNAPFKMKSLSFNEKNYNFNGFETLNKLSNDNNDNNKLNNDENQNKNSEMNINKDEIKEKNIDSNNSSFCLILDSEEEKNQFKNENSINEKNNISKRKFSSLSNGYETTEDCSPRTSSLKNNTRTNENNIEESISSFNTRKNFMKFENNKINEILKEYSSVKDMIENLDSSVIIRTSKFLGYAKACG